MVTSFSEAEHRHHAMDFAIRNSNGNDNPEDTVARAEQYYGFLTKEGT